MGGFRFSSFEKTENQLCFAIQLFFFFLFNHTFFKDASGSIPGAFRKNDIWNLFQNDVSGSIPERCVWLSR